MPVLIIIFFCLGIASLSLFLQKIMQPGMIFWRYYLWLTYWWIKNWRRKDRWKRKILPVLGMCVYCYNTWLTIIGFVIIFGWSWWLLLSIGFSYLFLEASKKMLKL